MSQLRKIKSSDLDDLIELYHQLHEGKGHSVDPDAFAASLKDILADPAYILWGVEEAGKIVATSKVVRFKGLSYGCRPFAVIENVVTHKEFRGKGFARKAVEACIQTAEEWGCYKAVLETGSKDEWKLRFYEKCGLSRGEKTAFIKRF